MSIWDDINILLEDSNEDDMTLDADDDGGETTTPPDDSTEGDNTDTQQQDDNTEGQDDNTQDDNTQDDTQTGEDDMGDDNTLDPDDDGTGEEGGEDTGDESGDDSSGYGDDDMGGEEETDANDPNAKLKELEKSIFDQLSKEQKVLKTKELKSLFDLVYNKCTNIINTISGAERTPEQAKVYDYVMNSLTDLQKYVKDYLFQIFDSKTYIENMVQLQKYLTVLDTVSNIFEEVKKSSDIQNGAN